MALINQALANLFNGISQQPPQLRLPSQCEALENYYPTIATGLNKRPPTEFKAKLASTATSEAFVSVLNRDSNERYVLVMMNGDLEVFDAFTGAKKTVSFPTGKSYLACTSPRKDFSAVTVADYTFIVNKTKTALMTVDATPDNGNVGYVFFTYNGSGSQRGMTISVDTGGGVAYAQYSGATSDLGSVISAMASQLSSSLGAGWSVSAVYGNIIKIVRNTGTSFTITAADDYGGSTMRVIKGSVGQFSDLPNQVDNGYVCYISPRAGTDGKGYYVRYDAATHSYIECPKPGALTDLDELTMPHKLVRNADGTFTFEPLSWEPRKTGDDVSNPLPSFVGRKINGVFFYRNRLGFLSDENVVLSTAGDYFNFFARTATTVVDSDPIDAAVANTKVSILRYAVPFNKVLLLFSDQTQFQLSGGDTLTPKSIKADPVTEFNSSIYCPPVAAGHELFFVVERAGFSGLREYFVNQDTLANDAADITAHVPAYLPQGIFKMAVSTSEDALLVLSENDPSALYFYKYFWGKDEKAQSAWGRFKFNGGDTILGCEFIGSVAYIVVKRSDGLYLEQLNLQTLQTDPGLPFKVHLDRKVSLTGTYDSLTNTTTWTLPWPYEGSVSGVLGAGFGSQTGASIPLTKTGTYTASAPGNWSASWVYIGVNYAARYRFSEQYVKDRNGVSITSARVKVRRMSLSYVNTGYFRTEVTPPGRETSTHVFTGKVLGVSGVKLGSPALGSGTFRFPVMADTRGVSIEVVNDSPFPSIFQNAEWEGEMVVQAQRT